MELLLNFGLLSFHSLKDLGLGDKKSIKSLVDVFSDLEFFKEFRYYGIEGKDKTSELSKPEELIKHLKDPDDLPYIVLDKPDSDKAAWKISFSFRKSSLLVKVLRRTKVDDLQKDVAGLIEIFERFRKYFASKIEFNFLASIILLDEPPYPKTGPPRDWGKFNRYGLVDFIEFAAEKHQDEVRVANGLVKATLPAGAQRRCTKDFCTINWIESAGNKDEIISRLVTREKWFIENADFPVDTDYNEHGDVLFSIIKPSPAKNLTFYSAFNRAGFKATVGGGKQGYDKPLFDELKTWVENGMTPDGQRLSKISLILPSRTDAVAIRPIADQYGFDLVLYPAADGNFWNPFPEEE